MDVITWVWYRHPSCTLRPTLQTGTGIMITSSHNPPEYNGLKMMIGGITLAEERIQALLNNLQNDTLSEGSGSASHTDIVPKFTGDLLAVCNLEKPLNVVVDCGSMSLAGGSGHSGISRLQRNTLVL